VPPIRLNVPRLGGVGGDPGLDPAALR
jgi:hypothetical protein